MRYQWQYSAEVLLIMFAYFLFTWIILIGLSTALVLAACLMAGKPTDPDNTTRVAEGSLHRLSVVDTIQATA
ncbi:hypothetical protein KFU94_18610 [Chloroflexi bacterium TSY]|nr:hypothetical protein [Chloroflexi bacterium TSY]